MAKEWWKESVIYQIYPRSFADSNGDGIGDLKGITGKLDYLVDLGVDTLWLSPINNSPMHDFGYDISDYRGIDPVFGTMDDFDELLDGCKKRKLRLMLDLVMNHSSHLHPWFVESRSSRDNPKRDWYIWRDGGKGKLPNNWNGSFGGSAWEWDEKTESYYLHSFLKEQPDLNWRNPELKKACFEEIEFWLKKGVHGFRLDVVNFYIKDDQLRDNPYKAPWNWHQPRPYEMQYHLYDKTRPEVHDVLRDFRALLDRYNAASVGEIFIDHPGDPQVVASYVGNGNDELHMAFDFSLLMANWGARDFYRVLERWYRALPSAGWPCNVLSNHDQPRAASRFAHGKETDARALLAMVMLLTTKGTPFIYYGEEIGLQDVKVSRSRLHDPVGIKYWPFHSGRDPERSPMQWSTAPQSGFSSAEPWLPLNKNWAQNNVEAQRKARGSMLNCTRELLRLRRARPELRLGEWKGCPEYLGRKLLVFTRSYKGARCGVFLNFGSSPVTIHTTEFAGCECLFSTPGGVEYRSSTLTLNGCSGAVIG